jgi:hypothetical protein
MRNFIYDFFKNFIHNLIKFVSKYWLQLLMVGIAIVLICSVYKSNNQPIIEGFDTLPEVPADATNPTMTELVLYGDIPYPASVNLYNKKEANDYAVTIETQSEPKSNFSMMASTLGVDPDKVDEVENAINIGIKASLSAAVTSGAVSAAALAGGGAALTAASVQAAQQAQDAAQGEAQDRAQEFAKKKAKAMKGPANALKSAIVKKFFPKSATKAPVKITGKLAARFGPKALKGVIARIAARMAGIVAARVGIAQTASTIAAATVIGLPVAAFIEILSLVFLGMSQTVSIAMAAYLEGNEPFCPAGYTRLDQNIPEAANTAISMIPILGDIFSMLGPNLCFTTQSCPPGTVEDGGLCYPPCEAGYTGAGPLCWSNYTSIGVGVLKGCPAGWDDAGLICGKNTKPNGVGTALRIYGGDCRTSCPGGGPWYNIANCHTECDPIGHTCDNKVEVAGLCYNACPAGYHFAGGNLCEPDGGIQAIGKFNNDSRLSCPADHPDEIDGLCYAKCPLVGGAPYNVTTKVPIWIKNRADSQATINARTALNNEKAKGKDANKNTIDALVAAVGASVAADMKAPAASIPYTLNPLVPADINTFKEPAPTPMNIVTGQVCNTGKDSDLGCVNTYGQNPLYTAWTARKAAWDSTHVTPPASTLESKIPTWDKVETIDPSKRLDHAPGAPYQCVGARGTSYGRGAGKSKFQMCGVTIPPPAPQPPSMLTADAFADDTSVYTANGDYNTPFALKLMCDFYYKAARAHAAEDATGTTGTFKYISKIFRLVASSERSVDVICEISQKGLTNIVASTTTTTATSALAAAAAVVVAPVAPLTVHDRRFYFAKLTALCSVAPNKTKPAKLSYLPCASTNTSGYALDILPANPDAADAKYTLATPYVYVPPTV